MLRGGLSLSLKGGQGQGARGRTQPQHMARTYNNNDDRERNETKKTQRRRRHERVVHAGPDPGPASVQGGPVSPQRPHLGELSRLGFRVCGRIGREGERGEGQGREVNNQTTTKQQHTTTKPNNNNTTNPTNNTQPIKPNHNTQTDLVRDQERHQRQDARGPGGIGAGPGVRRQVGCRPGQVPGG